MDRINATFDYDCILMGVGGGGTDPAAQINVLKSTEPLHQWFPNQSAPSSDWEARIDGLMDAQMRTLDFAQRKKLYDEVQAILAEELPMIFTVSPFHFAAARPDLQVGGPRHRVTMRYSDAMLEGLRAEGDPSPLDAILGRLIDEQYPNYEAVIPVENEKRLVVSRDALLAAVRRVALYSSSVTHQVRLGLEENRLTIAAEDIERTIAAYERAFTAMAAEKVFTG